MELTEAFAAVVTAPVVELDRASCLIAAHARPEIDVDEELTRLDRLAERGGGSLESVTRLLFEVEGFRGNQTGYYEPENSFLPSVLDRHMGIPISLTVLLIEVARRCDVIIDPLSTPGHFTACHQCGDERRYIDAFTQRVMTPQQFAEMFAALPAHVDLESFCDPIDAVETLSRMLRNLTVVYRNRSSRTDLVWVTELRSILPNAGVNERLEQVSALSSIGDYARAAKALDVVIANDDVRDRDELIAQADRLRARLN